MKIEKVIGFFAKQTRLTGSMGKFSGFERELVLFGDISRLNIHWFLNLLYISCVSGVSVLLCTRAVTIFSISSFDFDRFIRLMLFQSETASIDRFDEFWDIRQVPVLTETLFSR